MSLQGSPTASPEPGYPVSTETGRWSIPAALHSQFPQHLRWLTMVFDQVSPSPAFTQPASPKRPPKVVGLQEGSLQRGIWVGATSPAEGSGLISGCELCRDVNCAGMQVEASALEDRCQAKSRPRRLGLARTRADAMCHCQLWVKPSRRPRLSRGC